MSLQYGASVTAWAIAKQHKVPLLLKKSVLSTTKRSIKIKLRSVDDRLDKPMLGLCIHSLTKQRVGMTLLGVVNTYRGRGLALD